MLNVETSPEAQMLKDRMKAAKKLCVADMPAECHAQAEAGCECATSIAKSADSDPIFQESKSKSQPAIDACFDKYPVDIKKGMMEIFMMGKPMHKGGHKKWNHHKKHHNDTSSSALASGENNSGESGEASASSESNSNETSAERHRGGGGKHHGGGGKHHGGGGKHHGGRGHHCRPHRHHGPKNFTSGESNSNETSSESGGKSGESGERSQCRKTEEQKQCIKDEMKKLAKDAAFVDVINTLIHQKQKCKQIVTWSCSAKCPKKRKCVWKASKPCRQAFMEKMKTCLADKGFTLPPFMLKEHTQMFTTAIPDIPPQ